MAEVIANWKSVCEKISHAATKREPEYQYCEPQLVAISKCHPITTIISLYEAGQRHFGESYAIELMDKSYHPRILDRCKDIQWHFVGSLHRNKVNRILSAPNLYVVETVSCDKLAILLSNSWKRFRKSDDIKLNVMVQVNTSQEEEKSGCDIAEVSNLVRYIIQSCPNLKFIGLMTIGKMGHEIANGPNPDFICLIKCREKVVEELGIDIKDVELSMGMSNDYEHAIELGSTNVRVGTAIFGERPQK